MEKVSNDPDTKVEIVDWGWNQAIDLADSNAYWTWEVDTDTAAFEPVDLKADLSILNFGNGAYGAVANENNPDLTNGFSIFTPVRGNCRISTGTSCVDNSDCPSVCQGGSTPGGPCDVSADCGLGGVCDNCTNAQDFNGTLGNNRAGRNSCFFKGPAGIGSTALATLGLPEPPDDDIDNNSAGGIDEYVTANGPIRNMDIFAFNGPDMRFSTLEDIYGDTGETFQAAVGMLNVEKASEDALDPVPSYGVGVDDMYFQWRELELVDDVTTCTPGGPGVGGECAVIDLQTVNFFEGNTLLKITVLEKSPPVANDCDFDGTPDVPATTDCDGNLTADLPVKATSQAEPAGEIVYANQVGPFQYTVDLPVSALYNVDGVLFVQGSGTQNPAVTVLYFDEDDGTGQICKNDVDPVAHGRVESTSTLFFSTSNVVLLNAVLGDNGDDDGWADSNETVSMQIELSNKSGVDLSGIVARLQSNDPKVECVINPSLDFGDLPEGESALSTGAFQFKVADVQREGTCSVGLNVCTTNAQCVAGGGDSCSADLEDFSITLTVILASNEFDATIAPQRVTLDLDLDATGGTGPGTFSEGFETGTFNTFTSMNIDDGKSSEVQSEGYRCQYSDPDWVNSNSYGQITDCWLAASPAQATDFYWRVNKPSDDGGNRAYEGNNSIHMGRWNSTVSDFTTPLATLEALGSNNPIYLGWDRVCETTRTTPCTGDGDCPGGESCVGVTPELSFKHQISLADSRNLNTGGNESADGAVAMIQLADAAGNPVGNWIKVDPTLNVYDTQRTDNYTNCFFDPIDDGSTEDDFDDPSDPDRRLGPSSLCFPEYTWVHQGSTVDAFDPTLIANASDGPGLQGSAGVGTWIETKVNLTRFRGRSLRLRFISSAIKAGSAVDWEALFGWNDPPLPTDDGWWVDDIQVKDALLTSPATVTADVTDNSGLPGCGGNCTAITASLAADPTGTLPAPGQLVELSAVGSSADKCSGGTLQYQFRIGSTVLRGWTDNPILVQAPEGSATYTVDVRCSSLTTCTGSASLPVNVNCPASGNLGGNIAVSASSTAALAFDGTYSYHYCEGTKAGLAAYTCSFANYPATGNGASYAWQLGTPTAGNFNWALFRVPGTLGAGTGFCNDPGVSWGNTGRDAVLP
jgi:hypothetical protein